MKNVALKCPQCGANLDNSWTRCEFCGTNVKLSDDKQHFIGVGTACPNCDANNPIGDKHCGNCGEKLIAVCPVPNCQEPNSVWRKFCRKCGRNIVDTHIDLLEKEQAKYTDEMEYHTKEISKIQNRLPDSKMRETGVKIVIGIIGGVIALAFLQGGSLIGIVITLIITVIIIAGYDSSEEYNLIASIVMHKEDLERIQRSYKINAVELEKIKSLKKKNS